MQQTSSFIEKIVRAKPVQFLCFWLLTAALYTPACKAGFVAEFLQMYFDLDRISTADFLNRSHAEVKSFYQFTQVQLLVWLRLLGTHYLPWYLLFTALHALNGALCFWFFRRLFADFRLPHAATIALCGSLLFFTSPNITEVTVWKAGYHYLTGILLQLSILLATRRFLLGANRRYVVVALVLFALSIFTLEIWYITPALVLALCIGYYRAGLIDKAARKKAVLEIFVPQVLLFVVYLITFRVVHGAWVAHYGVTDGFRLDVAEMLFRVVKYLSNIFLLVGHYPESTRFSIYALLSVPWLYGTLAAGMVAWLVVLVWRFKKLSQAGQIVCFLLLGLIGSLVLVSPIYFDDMFSLYNSRRSYQPGLFAYMLVSVGLALVAKKRKAFYMLFLAYFFIGLTFAIRKMIHWKTAGELQFALLQKPEPDDRTVLLLNLPCYYKDVRIYPAGNANEFNRQMMLFRQDSIRQLYEVSSYNMQHTWDGAHVTVLDSLTLKVTLNQWGTWWMYNYTGAGSYENEVYRVEMTDPGHEYLLHLKKNPSSLEIRYQQGSQWKTVDFSRMGEQW